MGEDKIVQFVCFETILNTEQFVTQWEQYNRSVNSDVDVTLQQSENNGVFKYIAQHRCAVGELKFIFTRAKKSSRTPEPEIKAKQAGGYLVVQAEKINDAHPDESKIFAFLTDATTNLDVFRQLTNRGKLNIYEAYYENCQYAFILEFFVKNKFLSPLLEQLKAHTVHEVGVYKECALQAI
ncbi:MAG: hypothetical protein ABIU63_03935 [Chitinophagaceae bacterium]